jgi:hypothetical protein
MSLEKTLDNLHEKVTEKRVFQLFTVFTRLLLAIGFIPPSIPKILYKPFTVLPDSHPVGHYFNALYQTGFYYQFIGWTQIIAAVLLLIPRTSHLGALMFLPIIVNIAVLTSSVGFKGTWLITLLMSLAATYLVAWEYDRLKPILFQKRKEKTRPISLQFISIPLFFAVGGVILAVIWAYIRLGNFQNYFALTGILSGIGLVFGIIFAIHYKFMHVGKLEKNGKFLMI